ncbi:MAG: hypothetical protein HDT28_04640 [Clostridiales bacterium]|nr:hypothetical protein [Clostridiales bacterium]
MSLIIVLVIGVLAGFTDPFKSDGTIHKAGFGETIVMEKELPDSGTPSDYDLISNLQFAAYKIHHASFFKGVSDGASSADLGISSYTQSIHNTRVATGDGIVYAETISSSSLKNLAEQKYADNGIIIFRPSTSVSNGKATYGDKAYAMSYDDYSAAYGTVPNQLSKYVVTKETILGVKDLNAPQTQSQANGVLTSSDESDDGFGFDFYVPENLVRGEDGNYLFELTLDADKSSIYYRNEVRTLGGADQNPKFYAVTLTVCIDENWTPLYVTVVENYDIAIPVLGAMNCTSKVTEIFTQIDDPNGEVPERDFFTPFVEQAKLDGFTPPEIPAGSSSPADYLAGAFADYISGAKNLDLSLDIKNDYLSAYNVKASVNIKDLDIQALIGSLYFRYADDRVNIKCNNVNGYIEASDLAALSGNADIAALMSALPKLDLDVTQIFGGDMLGRVFNDCEMTSDKGVTRIRMPFDLDLDVIDPSLGKANIDASIYIRDDDKALQSISGVVEILGQTIKIEAKPLKQAFSAPSTDGAVNLKGALDFIPDIIKTATSKTFGVSGNIAAQGATVGVTAYIDTTDRITADAVLSMLGVDLSVKYVNDVVYVKVGNIDARGTAEDLPDLLKAIQAISGMDVDALVKTLKTIMPTTLSEYTNMLNSLTVTDNELGIGLKFLTAPIDIKLTRDDGKLSGVNFGIDFDRFGIKVNASADLALAYPEPRAVEVPTGAEYITFAQLTAIIKSAIPYAQAKGFDLSLGGKAGRHSVTGNAAIDISGDEINACGSISAFGQAIDFAVADGTTYVSNGKLKFKGNADSIGAIKPAATELMNNVTIEQTIDVTKLINTMLDSVKSVTVDENGVLYVNIKRGDDISLTVSVDIVNGIVTANGTALGYAIDITADMVITDGVTVDEPQDKYEYIDISVFAETLEKAAEIVDAGAFAADMQVNALGQSYAAKITVDFADGALKASLDMQDLGLNATVIGKTAYVSYKQINIVGSTDDIPALLTALGDIIPTDIQKIIDAVLNGNIEVLKTINTALSALTSLTYSDGALTAVIDSNDLSVAVTLALDLSNIELITSVDGEQVKASLTGLAATNDRVNTPVGEFAQASEIIKAAQPFIPLALDILSSKAMSVSLGGNINGYTLSSVDGEEVRTEVITPYSGNVYIGFEHGLQAQAELTISGVKVVISITNGKIYASIGDGIKIYEQLSLNAIYDILEKIDGIKAGVYEKATAIIDAILNTTLDQIIDAASLYPVQNGFGLSLTDIIPDVSSVISLDFVNDDKLAALGLNIQINETSIELALTSVYGENGTLQTLSASGEVYSLDLGIQAADVKTVAVTDEADYIPLSLVTEYIAPAFDLIESAHGAKYITLDLGATAELWNGKTTDISGTVAISLDPLAVEAKLNLFDGTADTTEVNIKLVGKKVYVDSGKIKLSFDIDADRERIYEVLTHYLDEDHYLMQEVKKLLVGGTSASAFSSISLLVERLGEISGARDIQNVIGLTLSSVGNIAGDSTLKTLIGMFNVLARNGELTVGVNALGMTVNATPHLTYTEDGAYISGATATTNLSLGGKAIGLSFNVTDYYIGSTAIEITAPAADYVSIAEFVEAIDNGVSTFTTKYERIEGDNVFEDITVEAQSFKFDYEIFAIETNENGEAVKDAEGRDKPLTVNGVKAVAKKISVKNIDGKSALKLSFVHQADENGKPIEGSGKYKLNLEAHIYIDIQTATDGNYNAWSSGNTLPVYLDLYVVNNSSYPDGLAFVDYREQAADGTGERISIDYRSVLQIVAAVLNIMGLDDETVGQLVGKENVQKLDTTVFESMDIAGLNELKATLKNGVKALNYAKDGAAKLGEAWNTVFTAGSIDGLTAQLETLAEQLGEATELFELAKNAMTGEATADEQPEEQPAQGDGKVNGKLFKDIVNGISFKTETSGAHKILSADIDNEVTTQTEGTSNVTVKMTDGAVKNTVEEITVGGLDVNTAKLKTFALPFEAGAEVEIEIPADYNQNNGKADYSDISKVKHLLYDVMNTAGMMEFEIGSTDASSSNTDNVSITISLGTLDIINIKIRINAKVKIMSKTEYLPLLTEEEKLELIASNAGTLPQFMTAAAITINNSGNTTYVHDSQTQLFFFNNKIYISGAEEYTTGTIIKSYKTRQIAVVYTLEDMANLMSDTDKLMDNFVFYLIPFKSKVLAVINLRDMVKEQIKKDYSANATPKTFANIFGGYNYNDGNHTFNLDLQALAQNTMLGNAEIIFNGANNEDDDDIVTNNYVSKLTAKIDIMSFVNINLTETLRNVNLDQETQTISSSGLGDIKVQSVGNLGTYDFVTTIGQIKNYTAWTPYSQL